MEKKRNSNIEILRIIAMFLIVWHHFGYVAPEILGDKLTFNSFIVRLGFFMGKIGVNIFFIITGYFQCKGKFNKKRLLSTIATTEFYGFIVILIIVLHKKLSFNGNILSYFPIISSSYWFITDYIIIYLLSPYLNVMLNNLPKKQYRELLVTVFIIWCVIPNVFGIFEGKMGSLLEFNQLIWGIIMYILGGYLRLHGFELFRKQKNNIVLLICSIVLIIIETILTTIFSESLKCIRFNDANTYINNPNNILILLPSLTLFSLFTNMKFRHIEYINKLASTMLGVYLIHTNVLVDYIKTVILNIPQRICCGNALILTFILTADIMCICCIIELIRIQLAKIAVRMYNKISYKLQPKQ